MFCGMAILLAIYELRFSGWRRLLAIIVLIGSLWLIYENESKGSQVLMVVAVVFSGLTLLACRFLRTTPTFIFAGVVLIFSAWALVGSDPLKRIAFGVYGDGTDHGPHLHLGFHKLSDINEVMDGMGIDLLPRAELAA